MITNLFIKMAGADEALLKKLPYDERVWVSQIGMALMLSYAFISMTLFYSLGYLAHSGGEGSYLTVGIITFIMTTLIILMDRAFILSDWYYRLSGSTLLSFLKRIITILVRLGLSLFMAYVMSIFLILRFYDAKITEVMRKEHFQANEPYRTAIAKFQDDYRKSIAFWRQKADDASKELESLRQQVGGFLPADSELNDLKNRIDETTHRIDTIEKRLRALRDDPAYRDYLMAKRAFGCTRAKIDLEEHSTIPTTKTICGESYTSSGIPGRGKRYENLLAIRRSHQAQMQSLENDYRRVLNQIETAKSELKEARQAKKNLQSRFDKRKQTLLGQIEQATQYKIQNLQEELDAAKAKIKQLLSDREKALKRYMTKLRQEGVYKEMRDGMMARYAALQKLYADPEFGAMRKYFTWLLEAMMVILEMAPLLMKTLFAKPSSYAAALRMSFEKSLKRLEEEEDTPKKGEGK